MFNKITLLFAATALLGGLSSTMNAADFIYDDLNSSPADASVPPINDNVIFNFNIGYFGTVADPSQTWTNNVIIQNVATTAAAPGNDAYTTFAGSVTGSGPISMGSAAGFHDLVFTGNMQGYTGPISLFGDGTSMTLGDPTSSVLQFGGVAIGGTVAQGVVTAGAPGTRFIDNVSGASNVLTSPNIIFNYSQDASYDFLKVTNVFAPGRMVAFTGSANLHIVSNIIDGAFAASVVQSGTGTVTLLGTNGFTGSLTVSAGTLALGVNGTLPVACPVTVNGGILDIGAFTNTIGSLTLIDGSVVGATPSTTGLTSAAFFAHKGTITATLSGSGSLVKTTGGVLNLSGKQLFTGALEILAGRVNMNTTSMAAAINVAGGATISGTGISQGLLSMADGSIIALAGGLTTASITTNGVTFANAASIVFDLAPDAGVTYDVITYGAGTFTAPGNLTISGYRSSGLFIDTVAKKITYTMVSGTRTWNTTDGTWSTGGVTTNFNDTDADPSNNDQKFFNGDTVIFGDIANDSVVTLTGALRPASVTVNNSANAYTFSGGTIDGASSLTKSGAGTLVLASANSYTGVTTLNEGVISVSDIGNGGVAGNLGAASNASSNLVFNGGTLLYTGATASSDRGFTLQSGGGVIDVASADLTLSGVATGPGALTKSGAGTLILSGANDYSGGTNISAGMLSVDTGGSLGSGAVNNNAMLAFSGSDSKSFANAISGSGSVVQSGSGVTTLSGANDYSGGTNISAGMLVAGSDSAFGSGAVTLSGGTLAASGGPRVISNAIIVSSDASIVGSDALLLSGSVQSNAILTVANSGVTTMSGPLSGSGSITKSGAGTLVLASANSYTGVTSINGGVISVSDIGNGGVAGNLGAASNASSNLVFNGGTLLYTGATASSDRGFTLQSGGGVIDVASADLTLSGVATGPGALTKSGAGTLSLSGANDYSGGTTISAGVLAVDTGGSLGSGAVNNNAMLAFSGSDSKSFANVISGSGSVVQSGSGVTTLSGANDYSGGTTISAGMLAVDTGGSLGSGAVNNNAVLAFSGSDSKSVANSISGSGSVVQSGSGVTTLSGANDYSGGSSVSAGTLAAGSDSAFGSGAVSLSGGALAASGGPRVISNAIIVSSDASIVASDALLLSGSVQSDAILTVANSGVTTMSGPLSGSGSVVLSGPGKLSLETPGDYMLATPISGAGTFELGGSGITTLSGSVLNSAQTVVASGRTLDLGTDSARAQLTAMSIMSGATLRGQGTVSSLSNAGMFSPGNSPGIVIVTGDFTNTGTLHIEIAGLGAPGTPNGHDQVVVGGTANLGGQLLIDYTNGVILGDHSYRFIAATSVNGAFASTTINPAIPANMLVSVTVDSAGVVFNTFQNLALVPGVPAFGGLTALAVDEGRGASELMRTRLDSQRRLGGEFVDRPWAAYANVTGSDTNTDSDASNFDRSYIGGRGGLEQVVADGVTIGGNLGYDRGRASLHAGAGGGKITQDHLGGSVYVSHPLFDSRSFVYLGAFGGVSSYETERNSVSGTSKGDTDGWDAGAVALLGYDFPVTEELSITPYVGLTYTYAAFNAFTESGSGSLDLALDDGHYNSLRSKLGFDIDWKMPTESAKLTLGVGLAWEHELLDDSASLKGGFATAGAGRFEGEAPTLSRDLLSVGPQMILAFGDGNQIRLGYRYQYGFNDETGHRVDLTFSRRF
jgi:fibronectin-binding autotransporter adhesin